MREVLPAEEIGSWCEVSEPALRRNVETLRRRLRPGAVLGVVVKSNAYGHGLLLCARQFLLAGAEWLVVNSPQEAQALRSAGLEAPLYICAHVRPSQARSVARTGARVVLCDGETARALAQAGRERGRPIRLHLKVETGTHRQGVPPAEALELARLVQNLEGVELEGLTTHYADIEDTTDHAFARKQLELLEGTARRLREAGIGVPMVHSANSAATLLWPEAHASLVRVGIAAYGLWPSGETYATALQRQAQGKDWMPQLEPALSWKARITQIKRLSAGSYIGYGRTFRATHDMRLGVLPVGYYEGYDRRLSNVAHVLVGGVRAPVRGRVCMNMVMVDLTHVPQVEAGEVATLLGRDGDQVLSAEQWAQWMGSINYEVVSRIHPEQPRWLRREDGSLE